MPGPKVRADYDALKSVAQSFSQQADETAKSLQALQGQMDTLRGGDWVGQGANAFYAEMNDQVLPTVQRLHSALQASADVSNQISQLMKTAEEDAARVLHGDGGAGAAAAGAAVGAAAGVVAGAAAYAAAAGVGAAATAGAAVGLNAGGAAELTGIGGAVADVAGAAARAEADALPVPPSPMGQVVGQPTASRMTNALNSLDSTIEASLKSQTALQDALQNIQNGLDSQSEMGETESLRLQMAMDRLSKMSSTLSNVLKKINDTSDSIIKNIK